MNKKSRKKASIYKKVKTWVLAGNNPLALAFIIPFIGFALGRLINPSGQVDSLLYFFIIIVTCLIVFFPITIIWAVATLLLIRRKGKAIVPIAVLVLSVILSTIATITASTADEEEFA